MFESDEVLKGQSSNLVEVGCTRVKLPLRVDLFALFFSLYLYLRHVFPNQRRVTNGVFDLRVAVRSARKSNAPKLHCFRGTFSRLTCSTCTVEGGSFPSWEHV